MLVVVVVVAEVDAAVVVVVVVFVVVVFVAVVVVGRVIFAVFVVVVVTSGGVVVVVVVVLLLSAILLQLARARVVCSILALSRRARLLWWRWVGKNLHLSWSYQHSFRLAARREIRRDAMRDVVAAPCNTVHRTWHKGAAHRGADIALARSVFNLVSHCTRSLEVL